MNILILTHDAYHIVHTIDEIQQCIGEVRHNVSTDEIFPVSSMFTQDVYAKFVLSGDRMKQIGENFLVENHIDMIIAGNNFGCGSAREHAALGFAEANIRIIFAQSFNRTFRNNATYNGLLTSTDFSLISQCIDKDVNRDEMIQGFSPTEKQILHDGDLFSFYSNHPDGMRSETSESRPMTVSEKIIARHSGVSYVKPGQEVSLSTDIRFSYEVFTPKILQLIEKHGYHIDNVVDPSSIYFFEDHFIMSTDRRVEGLLETQKKFADAAHITRYAFSAPHSGICHAVLAEHHAKPGQLIVGTDSHTPTTGALNCFALPVGFSMLAYALLSKHVFCTVPPSVKITLQGRLRKGVTAKDIILTLFQDPYIKNHNLVGCVLEYAGDGLSSLSLDEHMTLTNMASEAGALTGIIHPNPTLAAYCSKRPDIQYDSSAVYPDEYAVYQKEIILDLYTVVPMVALPPEPTNVRSIRELPEKIPIQKAFIGSCVGGKYDDLIHAAEILHNQTIHPCVELIIQPSTMDVYERARSEGLDIIFIQSGAKFLPSACGACIGQGPGSPKLGEAVISSSNRNYKGRMGEGNAYLANTYVVAASALAGYITIPDILTMEEKNMITQQMAKQAIEAAESKAKELGITITTVVVDDGGLIIAASRMDHALPISPRFAFIKAYTASVLHMPTTTLAEYAGDGKPYHGITAIWNGEFTTIPGGLPVTIHDRVVGGVGCGGGDPSQDTVCAQAALEAITK